MPYLLRLAASAMTYRTYIQFYCDRQLAQGEMNVKICGIHCYSNTKKYMTYMDSMYTSGLWTAGMIQANECLGAISTCLPRCTAL